MIVVIQCAATKSPDAGRLRRLDGTPVTFVAHPGLAPPTAAAAFARPDDLAESGETWRDVVVEYNSRPGQNPCGLLPACRLYRHRAYRRLVEAFGESNVYVLSAGWGLISAGFLTPYYDITFSQQAEGYKRRRRADAYQDFRMLPEDGDQDVVFLGGKEYIPLFCALAAKTRGRRTVVFNSRTPPEAPGCSLRRYSSPTKTNWHYECAGAPIGGRSVIEG